ncbi:hypothetical protein [Rivibacter subsaxonicus]|uniref:Uncharacterized protein n=1 Tax=Rivibacter subsaxonicus TaxID=457575 RepID=A0A4Q7VWD0_9BURK|nr:hypothetical protein [Rivibacter subsaxonicus]RZU01027.1 hypothetical protein EV670_1741 [Rivibacter subsaxonicus]
MSSTPADPDHGLDFRRDPRNGKRNTTPFAKAVFGATLHALGAQGASAALEAERDWRRHYPRHLLALTEAQLRADGAGALAAAGAGLDAAWSGIGFERGGRTLALAEAMRAPVAASLHTHVVRGQGAAAVERWRLPLRGRWLEGAELEDQIDRWLEAGVIEPGHARALRRVMAHPEWFDLSDRHVALLGAGSEAGPLQWLARWRANIVALDLPRPAVWQRIEAVVRAGNARLLLPLRDGGGSADWSELAGCDLLRATPEVGAWLCSLGVPLDLAAIAYADGATHVRVSLAMDAVMQVVCEAQPASSRMFMATPTDIFAVPARVAEAAMRAFAERRPGTRAADAVLGALSGGSLLQPHVGGLLDAGGGERAGIIDALVLQQGPNYALAKRLQQWRALLAWQRGERVSFNVTPSTTTTSVVKHPALKAGFAGAHHYAVEVFEPATTNAISAALWVHDLRHDEPAPAGHPLLRLAANANHGGLWRVGYLPRSALPLAAVRGLLGGTPA